MTYEAGFDAGERQSFRDRKTGERLKRPGRILTEWDAGFWDAYPGSPSWSINEHKREARVIATENGVAMETY